MRWLLKSIFWLLAGVVVLLVALAALAVQSAPMLAPPQALSAADIVRAKDFLQRNDPRLLPPTAGTRRLDVAESEVSLLLGHLALRRPGSAVDVRLQPGVAHVRASAALPWGWLNLDALLAETPNLPEFTRLRIGHLPVPAWAANAGLRYYLGRLAAQPDLQLATEMIEHAGFGAQQLQLSYRWQADSLDRMLNTLWPAAEQARIQAYHERLREISAPSGDPVPLEKLLPPLFALAKERSQLPGGDAAAENRAAVLTLALHANGRGWAGVMPAARAWAPVRPQTVLIFGREDFAMHFLVSAVLAIEGGGPLADAMGVDKELADSRSGSGFSFNDIAADRAGTRFGLLARSAPEKLQSALAAGVTERDFMPEVADLPEFMTERQFAERYGAVGAPAYQQMMATIESRLDGVPLFK